MAVKKQTKQASNKAAKAATKKVAKKAVGKKAAKKTVKKIEQKEQVWCVSVRGTAQVRAYFEIEAASENEAWEKAQDELNYVRFSDDDMEFFEVRLDEEISDVSKA